MRLIASQASSSLKQRRRLDHAETHSFGQMQAKGALSGQVLSAEGTMLNTSHGSQVFYNQNIRQQQQPQSAEMVSMGQG